MSFMHTLKHLIEFTLFENYKFVTQNYRELFKKLEEEGLSEEDAQELWQNIYSVRQALKGQNREQEIQNAKNLEQVLDILNRVELVSRANKWHKLTPSKYRKQLKDRIEEFADKIADYTDYEDYKNNFLPPIAAAIQDVDTFFSLLDSHIKGLSGTYNKIVKDINQQPGIEIETLLKQQIIAWVYDKTASCNIGTSSWCISRDTGYFSTYVTDEFRKQYFVWDFRYSTTDKKSLNAITLNSDMSIHHAAWKNNVNNYDAQRQFPNEPWFKYLKPLTNEQITKWAHSLKDQKINNPKTLLIIAVELDDIDMLKSILSNNMDRLDVPFIITLINSIKKSPQMIEILKNAAKNTSNYKVALQIATEFKDIEIFKNIFEGNTITKFDEALIADIILQLVEDDSFEMLKIIGESHPVLLVGKGKSVKSLIKAYQLKNKRIFDYLKSKTDPALILTLKKIVKLGHHPPITRFLDIFYKTL